MLNKIGLIGGGYIGGVLLQEIVKRRLAREVGMSDPAPFVNPNDPPEQQATQAKQSVAKGKALDIAEGTPTIRSDVRCYGSKDYSAIKVPSSSSTPPACPARLVPTAPSRPAKSC